MDERFLRPAISPDEAVDVPAVEDGRFGVVESERIIGTTPAVSATEQPHGYKSVLSDHPSVMRVRMRQAAAARDLVRGSNVQWSTSTVRETHTGVAVERGYVNDMPARAPMEHVLRGTVKRMVSQSGEYESPRMRNARRPGVVDISRKAPTMIGAEVRARTVDAVGTMIDRIAHEAFSSGGSTREMAMDIGVHFTDVNPSVEARPTE